MGPRTGTNSCFRLAGYQVAGQCRADGNKRGGVSRVKSKKLPGADWSLIGYRSSRGSRYGLPSIEQMTLATTRRPHRRSPSLSRGTTLPAPAQPPMNRWRCGVRRKHRPYGITEARSTLSVVIRGRAQQASHRTFACASFKGRRWNRPGCRRAATAAFLSGPCAAA